MAHCVTMSMKSMVMNDTRNEVSNDGKDNLICLLNKREDGKIDEGDAM